jgi:hypothetical protein
VTTAAGYQYPVDRWRSFDNITTGGWSVQRVADAPVGFTSSFRLTVTTAQSSFTSGELGVLCEQAIEGNNISDLSFGTASAKTITISFWVKSSITGTFGFAVFNNNGASIDRTYPTTYAISSANTWEYKTITIAGDTAGTWQTGTGTGMYVAFEGYGASDQFGTANTWNAGAKFLASGIVNLFATNGATWQVTGVQLEAGTTATPFERRPIGQELALCQRYFYGQNNSAGQAYYHFGIGSNNGNTTAFGTVIFPVTMRAKPSVTISAANTFYIDPGITNYTSVISDQSGINAGSIYFTGGTSSTNNGNRLLSNNTSAAYIFWSAEL